MLTQIDVAALVASLIAGVSSGGVLWAQWHATSTAYKKTIAKWRELSPEPNMEIANVVEPKVETPA